MILLFLLYGKRRISIFLSSFCSDVGIGLLQVGRYLFSIDSSLLITLLTILFMSLNTKHSGNDKIPTSNYKSKLFRKNIDFVVVIRDCLIKTVHQALRGI